MKALLIIGAGGHGRVIAEIASACGYQKIEFLDDENPEVLGKVDDLEKFRNTYAECFIGIGNNLLRLHLLEKAEVLGYTLPILIHPTAYVSPAANLGSGSVIEPMAIVNTNASIEKGVIISAGAIVDHDTVVEKAAHVNVGAIVKAGGIVSAYEKLEAGEIRMGYRSVQGQ